MWIAVIVLFCTGVVLITGEPERSLGNWVFQVKMGLLVTVLLVTVGFSRVVNHNLDSWDEAPPHQITAKLTGDFTGIVGGDCRRGPLDRLRFVAKTCYGQRTSASRRLLEEFFLS